MSRINFLWIAGMTVALVGCNNAPPAQPVVQKPVGSTPTATSPQPTGQPAGQPAAKASKGVLALEGPGGSVALGDTLEQAKKAFPPPSDAQIRAAANFAILNRDGWTWMTTKPMKAFEVSLKDGKVVGMALTMAEEDAQARKKLKEETLTKVGAPTAKTEGKSGALYAWDAKPDARFLMVMDQGFMAGMVMSLIGNQDDLKLLNYRVDDTETMIKQMDMGAEAMKGMGKQKTP